jgi:hypothetical protein
VRNVTERETAKVEELSTVGRDTAGLFADEHVEHDFRRSGRDRDRECASADAVERQRTEMARFISPPVAELISSEQGEQLLAGRRA